MKTFISMHWCKACSTNFQSYIESCSWLANLYKSFIQEAQTISQASYVLVQQSRNLAADTNRDLSDSVCGNLSARKLKTGNRLVLLSCNWLAIWSSRGHRTNITKSWEKERVRERRVKRRKKEWVREEWEREEWEREKEREWVREREGERGRERESERDGEGEREG